MLILWVCVVIAVVVFGVMIYSIVKFRHSQGAVAANFDHRTRAEIVWTVIPIVDPGRDGGAGGGDAGAHRGHAQLRPDDQGHRLPVDVALRIPRPATSSFFSTLARDSDAARQLDSGIDPTTVPNYLLDVDHPLVVPVGTKVRVLLTADDVIHAWWVPAFGMKKDAIPGFVNELWFRADEPGIYRGQCAELCGRDHGFMPIVVDVRSQAEFDSWLKAQQEGATADGERSSRGTAPPRRSNEFMTHEQHCTSSARRTGARSRTTTRITTTTARRRAGAAGCSRPITKTSARCTCCSAC